MASDGRVCLGTNGLLRNNSHRIIQTAQAIVLASTLHSELNKKPNSDAPRLYFQKEESFPRYNFSKEQQFFSTIDMVAKISHSSRLSPPPLRMTAFDTERISNPFELIRRFRDLPDDGSSNSNINTIPMVRLRRSSRIVGFGNPLVEIEPTISRDEMTEEEKKNYWLQADDYSCILKNNERLMGPNLDKYKAASKTTKQRTGLAASATPSAATAPLMSKEKVAINSLKKNLWRSLKKQACFDRPSNRCSVYSTLSRCDLVEEETEAYWFSKEECTRIKQHNVRKLRFDPSVETQSTISRHDMTNDEMTNYWYQPREFDCIQRRNEFLIQRAKIFSCKAGEPLQASHAVFYEACSEDIETTSDGNRYLCLRGLEISQAELFRTENNRKNSVRTVLIEQDFQGSLSYRGENYISELYIQITASSMLKALQLAWGDRKAVKEM